MSITTNKLFVFITFWLVCNVCHAAKSNHVSPEFRAVAQYIKISTELGDVQGQQQENIRVFKGIAYAQAPVDDLRWRSARAVAAWSGIKDAREYGHSCVQKQRLTRAVTATSEDCLNLNIWAPLASKTKAPVMVWIHGGAFRFGSGSQKYYDGSEFAKSGVVLVTINYRLGRFGFFSHPALDQENDTVNFGLSDQIKALRWVRENIWAFGGDPNNVTIFGESAGAVSVGYHLTMDASRGLFNKAILQSGGGAQIARQARKRRGRKDSLRQLGLDWAERQGLGSDVMASELRKITAERVLEASKSQGGLGAVTPVLDGFLVQDDIATRFSNGEVAAVPIITGSNSFEGSLLSLFRLSPKFVLMGLGKRRLKANRAYQVSERNISKTDLAYEVFGDGVFAGPARDMAIQALRLKQDAYVYSFDYRKLAGSEIDKGAHHGWEIPFVFKTLDSAPELFTAQSNHHVVETMSSTMHQYWVNFARSGNPNSVELPNWPMIIDQKEQKTLLFKNSGPRVAIGFRKRQFDFQRKVYADRLRRNQK
jgi:para-nitrobenzyl esterase